MHQIILQHVHALAAGRGVRILYACETGSRGRYLVRAKRGYQGPR